MRFALAALAFLSSSIALSAPYEITAKKSTVSFKAIGSPGWLRINATGGHAQGTLEDDGTTLTGTVKVAVKELDTGVDKRTEHMLSETYLDAAKYPWAKLAIDHVKKDGTDFTGQLTLKDLTKPVKGTIAATDKAITCEFHVNLADYRTSIPKPTYAGIGVEDDVTVTVLIER